MYDLVILNDVYDVQIIPIAYKAITQCGVFNRSLRCYCERRGCWAILRWVWIQRCVMHHFR